MTAREGDATAPDPIGPDPRTIPSAVRRSDLPDAPSASHEPAVLRVGGMAWGPRLLHDLVVYGVGGSGAKVINAFLLPVFTRILTPGDMGVIDLLTAAMSMLLVVGGLGLESALFYLYSRTDDPADRRGVVSTVLVLAVLATSVTSLLAVAGQSLLRTVVGPSYSSAYVMALMLVPFTLSAGIVLDVLRLEFRSRAYAVLSFLRAVGTALFAVAIVALTRSGVAGYMASQIVVAAASIVCGLWLVRGSLTARPQIAVVLRLLRYGAPLVPLGIGAWILAWSDRMFLAAFGYVGDLGYYAVANRFAQMTFLAVLALQTAWPAFALSASRSPGHRRAFATVFRLSALGLLAVVFLTSLAAEPIVAVALPAVYRTSVPCVPFLAGAVAAQGLTGVVSVGLLLTERTKRLALIGGATAVSNVLFNVLLIPRLGIGGAAVATFGSSVVSLGLTYLAAERIYRIGYAGRELVLASFAVGSAIAVAYLPQTASGLDPIAIGRLATVLVLTALAALALGIRPYVARLAALARTVVRRHDVRWSD